MNARTLISLLVLAIVVIIGFIYFKGGEEAPPPAATTEPSTAPATTADSTAAATSGTTDQTQTAAATPVAPLTALAGKTIKVATEGAYPPFNSIDTEGKLVGFDVEMAHHLARDLGVKVEFVEIEALAALPQLLAAGRIDLAMTGTAVTPERASEMLFSDPYLDETLGFVVKDHLRDRFSSWANIRELGSFSVAMPNLPYYVDQISRRAPTLKFSLEETLSGIENGLKQGTLDAVLLPAERGSVLSLLYPKYTVVVPEPDTVRIPLAYPVARRDQEWAQFVNTWIELKRRDGTIDALYGHWILGKHAVKREPRWSVIRNVLHWVD